MSYTWLYMFCFLAQAFSYDFRYLHTAFDVRSQYLIPPYKYKSMFYIFFFIEYITTMKFMGNCLYNTYLFV